jgi:hypothetical protein
MKKPADAKAPCFTKCLRVDFPDMTDELRICDQQNKQKIDSVYLFDAVSLSFGVWRWWNCN